MNFLKISISLISIATLIFLIFFFRSDIAIFFQNMRMAFIGTVNKDLSYRNLLSEKLNAEYSVAECLPLTASSSLMAGKFHLIPVDVYSNYPLNNYSSIVINAGTKENIKVGSPVLIEKNVLLGKVVSVRTNLAEVETLFSPTWKSSVFIGDEEINGLLNGGPMPFIDFISKDATVTPRMKVFNADASFPLGLAVGSLDSVVNADHGLWQQAKLVVSYDLPSIRQVFVVEDFVN